jgi:hypothetical protein
MGLKTATHILQPGGHAYKYSILLTLYSLQAMKELQHSSAAQDLDFRGTTPLFLFSTTL